MVHKASPEPARLPLLPIQRFGAVTVEFQRSSASALCLGDDLHRDGLLGSSEAGCGRH